MHTYIHTLDMLGTNLEHVLEKEVQIGQDFFRDECQEDELTCWFPKTVYLALFENPHFECTHPRICVSAFLYSTYVLAGDPAPYPRALCVAVYTELIVQYHPTSAPLLLTLPPHRVRHNSDLVPTKTAPELRHKICIK